MPTDPASYRTPGQFLNALLKERGWTTQALAIVLGVSEPLVTRMRTDQRRITAEMALSLEDVFGVPADDFLAIQTSFDLAKAQITSQPDPDRRLRARLYGDLPISEMVKRRWIRAEDIRDFAEVERGLTAFFGISALDEIENLPHAAKKTAVGSDTTPVQLAWLYRVRSIAAEMMVKPFTPKQLKAGISKLAALRRYPEELRKVPRILMECGVRFVLVEALPSSKIDGICCWLNERSPVVALSLRFDRIDNFWFVLRHELEHVLRRHGFDNPVIDAELDMGLDASVNEEERVANEAAADFCVPASQMSAFVERKAPFFAERDLFGFAKTLGVHPGLVAGQLRYKTGRYDLFSKHLVAVRKHISPSAMVDGWGDVFPVGD